MCCGPVCRGSTCHAKWAAGPAVRAGAGSSLGKPPASGSASTKRCSPNCTDAANSTWRARSSIARRSARCAGEKNWTEPNRSPQEGHQAPPPYGSTRHSASRAANRRESHRHHPTAAARRGLSAAARAARRTYAQARPCPGRPGVRLAAASRRVTRPRHCHLAGQAATAAWQRTRPHPLGHRTDPCVAASVSAPHPAVRAAPHGASGLPHARMRPDLLELPQTRGGLLKRALKVRDY